MTKDKNKSNGETDDEEQKGPPYYAGYYKNPDLVSHNCLEKEIVFHDPRFVDIMKCNPHLEEMAKPNRRNYQNILEMYSDVLAPDRKKRIKAKIAEEFAISPEEAEYVCRSPSDLGLHDSSRQQNKRMLQEAQHVLDIKAINRTYRRFRDYLRIALKFAHRYSVPPLFGNRATIISEIILRQLCVLYDPPMKITDRHTARGRRAKFLISVADWGAFLIEYLHYELVSDDIEKRRQTFMENRAILYPPEEGAGDWEEGEEEEEEEEAEPEEYTEVESESEAEQTRESTEEKAEDKETDEWETEAETEAETEDDGEEETEWEEKTTTEEPDEDRFADQEE